MAPQMAHSFSYPSPYFLPYTLLLSPFPFDLLIPIPPSIKNFLFPLPRDIHFSLIIGRADISGILRVCRTSSQALLAFQVTTEVWCYSNRSAFICYLVLILYTVNIFSLFCTFSVLLCGMVNFGSCWLGQRDAVAEEAYRECMMCWAWGRGEGKATAVVLPQSWG